MSIDETLMFGVHSVRGSSDIMWCSEQGLETFLRLLLLEPCRIVLAGTSAELSDNDAVRSAYLGL